MPSTCFRYRMAVSGWQLLPTTDPPPESFQIPYAGEGLPEWDWSAEGPEDLPLALGEDLGLLLDGRGVDPVFGVAELSARS